MTQTFTQTPFIPVPSSLQCIYSSPFILIVFPTTREIRTHKLFSSFLLSSPPLSCHLFSSILFFFLPFSSHLILDRHTSIALILQHNTKEIVLTSATLSTSHNCSISAIPEWNSALNVDHLLNSVNAFSSFLAILFQLTQRCIR